MKPQKITDVEWNKLDNASKYFPSVANERDTKVFRLSCELYEDVDPEILQSALDITIDRFPFYRSVLRRGVFWYYFETTDLSPQISEESLPLCAPLYNKNTRNLLFRVVYYKKRISLELFHALSDGKGALHLFQTLIYYYLVHRYKGQFGQNAPVINYDASMKEKMDDSFHRHFVGDYRLKLPVVSDKRIRAHRIRGKKNDDHRMKLIEGSMSVKDVLKEVKSHHSTLTVYTAALFMYSIYKNMSAQEKKRPVVLSVPINLRQFYESETTRNFFSTMNISYTFHEDKTNFDDIIACISQSFQKNLTVDDLNYRLNGFMSLEKNLLMRVIPLPLKDYAIRLANKFVDRGVTGAISNIGKITIPDEFDPYIRQFTVSTSTRRPQICLCSYKDRLVISFTSSFVDTGIQRTFFEFLSNKGIDIEIATNI